MSQYPVISGPDPKNDANLDQLLQNLQKRHNQAICSILLYGSCLRSGDIYDGLLDLYLICDDYKSAYGAGALAATNWLLPPNVFHAEVKGADKTLRAKVTVISIRDFQRGCSRAWFESYIWGRFAQPTCIVHARDSQTHTAIEDALTEAAFTLLDRAIPALPTEGLVTELWEQALGLSYATELRTERSERAAELAQSASEFYSTLTRQHAPALGHGFTLLERGDSLRYQSFPSGLSQRKSRLGWGLRRVQGKLLSVLRLVKALFTFEGGLDYIAWKLERHSGESITIPNKVRKAPLIYLWGFFWGLYRKGIFK
jgi:hypothetical protein